MKTLLTDFPEKNHKELARIARLICRIADPDFILLFGRYAGGATVGVATGYELLVITGTDTALRAQELLQAVEAEYPHAERTERYLFLHVLPAQFVAGNLSRSLFLQTVLTEGILLHDSRRRPYFRLRDFKPAQTYRRAVDGYAVWHDLGDAYLHAAQWSLSQGYARLAASNLHHAALAFLRSVELVCFGYQNPHTDLKTLCVLTTRFSAALGTLFGFPDRFDRRLFQRLESFRRNAPTSQNFVLHAEVYSQVSDKIERLGRISAEVCRTQLERLDRIRRENGPQDAGGRNAGEPTASDASEATGVTEAGAGAGAGE